MTLTTGTRRPRNVNAPRAAAILYGDWGTSKAYVIGIAFAVGGYSSFWLIAAMCVLTALVGVNYMAICKHYPDGGGVYASVRHRSEIISIVGAFLLIADYIVTAAISALSAFQYLGVSHPDLCAGFAILFIGCLNYFGPKHTGSLAFMVSVPTVVVVVVLAAFCIPHLGEAAHNLQPLQGGFAKNWAGFVGVVLALSGVEAIANSTGVMKLNSGSTDAKPNVSRTSTPAILWVMVEVCIFTALLGLAMNALGGLASVPTEPGQMNEVMAGGKPVRDYMLKYMGDHFVGGAFHSPLMGHYMGLAVSLVFGLLLLSAVNTAIVDLVAISFLMSRDEELPPHFQRLNSFGVPNLGLIVAAVVPALLVLTVRDVGGLADLYAVGVVGAIATNLGASSTDRKLGLVTWERVLMFVTFLIMLAIELTLFATKPSARTFATGVLAIGLILRGLAIENTRRKKKEEAAAAREAQTAAGPPAVAAQPVLAPLATLPVQPHELSGTPMMCAVRGLGKTLDFAIEEARQSDRPLYLLFIRPVPILLEDDFRRKWQDDPEARALFVEAKRKAGEHPLIPCYAVSDAVAQTIVDITATVGVSHLILGAPERHGLAHLLRGNIIREISDSLPDNIHLLVYA
jgi:amino acid transporter/nucleotide-binding universal stress UspA family protein